MKVIIPAAGKGTRMRPFTLTKPKPLLPVAGKPMIDHIIDRVLPLQPSEIWFITGHLKDELEAGLKNEYGDKVTLRFVEQVKPRGTAQAISLAKEAFDEDVLIIFSDTIFDADLSVIKDCKDDGIFWAMEVEDPRRFGVMVTDDNGHLKEIVEKPEHPISNLANIGLYYIKNTALLAEGLDKALEQLERTDKEIYHVDAFIYMLKHGAKIKVLPADGWYDCGTNEETLKTNKILMDRLPSTELPGVTIKPPVAIDPSATIENSTNGPYVSIGPNNIVKDSTLTSVIIDNNCTVESSDLNSSILGQHVSIKNKKGSFFFGDHSEEA